MQVTQNKARVLRTGALGAREEWVVPVVSSHTRFVRVPFVFRVSVAPTIARAGS